MLAFQGRVVTDGDVVIDITLQNRGVKNLPNLEKA
jgi:hypothetical protein